jgi:starch-binding outer membrane protein, SusD/RagB family
MRNAIIFLFCSIALFSCTGALDQNPLDKVPASQFWKTQADFDQAMAALYGGMQSNANDAKEFTVELPVWDCFTDDGYAQFGSGAAHDIVSGAISPTTGGYIGGLYGDAYKDITRANILIQQLHNFTGDNFADADKLRYEGEARFIRAFCYSYLYYYYGDVPLITEPLTLSNQYQAKVPAAQILKQITDDLDFAIANLNNTPYYQNSGHATVSSAQALKARVLIFAAYGNTGVPDATILTQVRDLAQTVMSQYSLSTNFEDIFHDATQENNPEIIFSIKYFAPNDATTWDRDYGDWIVASPLQNFLDDFECTDGLPYGVSPLTDKSNQFNNRDPRMAKTVFVDHPSFPDGRAWPTPSNPRPTGYGVLKFLDPNNLPYGFSTLSAQDAVVMRDAEVLLMYAEVQNELAGPDQSVYDAMTKLRARVNMPPYPAGLTQDEMRQRIRHERRIELAFEGLRYFDLLRWRIAGDVLNKVTDGITTYHFTDKNYKWPLPQGEIDKSQGVLVQNPDYK